MSERETDLGEMVCKWIEAKGEDVLVRQRAE